MALHSLLDIQFIRHARQDLPVTFPLLPAKPHMNAPMHCIRNKVN